MAGGRFPGRNPPRRSRTFLIPFTVFAALLIYHRPGLRSPDTIEKVYAHHEGQEQGEYWESWKRARRNLQQRNQETSEENDKGPPAVAQASQRAQKPGLFIPMTRLRECKRQAYLSSDPEWQSFIALTKDHQRRELVKSRLCHTVAEVLSGVKSVQSTNGKPLRLHARWLDFEFPRFAPVDHECSGLLWSDNKLAWVEKKYDGTYAQRMYKIFVPTALSSSIQTFITVYAAVQYQKLKLQWSKLGTMGPQQGSAGLSGPLASPIAVREAAEDASPSNASKQRNEPQSKPSKPSFSPSTTMLTSGFVGDAAHNSKADWAVRAAFASAITTYRKKSSHISFLVPRGACFLRGELGFHGPKGRSKFRVIAIYLPKEDRVEVIDIRPLGTWSSTLAPLETRP